MTAREVESLSVGAEVGALDTAAQHKRTLGTDQERLDPVKPVCGFML
jgi:hypothetical protein